AWATRGRTATVHAVTAPVTPPLDPAAGSFGPSRRRGMGDLRRFLGEAGSALAVMGGFVALSLRAAALEAAPQPDYPPAAVADADPDEAPTTWLVDGFNPLHPALLRGRPPHAGWAGADRP